MNNLKLLRENKNTSKTRFAEEIGVSTATIRRWENGTTPIGKKWVPAIKNVLQCTEADLFDKDLSTCDLKIFAEEAREKLHSKVFRYDCASVYYKQAELIRVLGDALIQTIDSIPDINAIHAKDEDFAGVDDGFNDGLPILAHFPDDIEDIDF